MMAAVALVPGLIAFSECPPYSALFAMRKAIR